VCEQNKTNVRRLFGEIWNKGHVAVADELFAPTYHHHDSSMPDVGRGPESEKKRVTAEGETVVARWSCRGTHKGELIGIAPTGKQFNITGLSIARFTNGKMFEAYVNWDALSLMQQLGVVPELFRAKPKALAASAW
jgi:predicted ester cyclase